ncbi:hypothetical protein [Paraburkholderia caribensis]|nr:hypothetical protein [Paraburkholderia caribensis]
MPNFSDNWRHLRAILAAYPAFDQKHDAPSLQDHLHAKALALFFLNATLATPALDRPTVAEALAGNRRWPSTSEETQFAGVGIPLSFLEDNGFISFYAGWVEVHCQTQRTPYDVHPSIVPLLDALEHLKDICNGFNGLVPPHYSYPADAFDKALADEFGGISASTLIPELCLEGSDYHLPPGNQNFSPLVSTYLWHALRVKEPPELAFRRWITCQRVNCRWAMPIQFTADESTERALFDEQLLAWIANDGALSQTLTTLYKQYQNENHLSTIVSPSMTRMVLNIGFEDERQARRDETIELERPTFDALVSAYPMPSIEGKSDLQTVNFFRRSYWSRLSLFYTWLIASMVETSVRVDTQVLASSGFSEKLLELAASRPVLRYVLFSALPDYESVNYRLFLLSRPDTCNIALFYLIQYQAAGSNRNGNSTIELLDTAFRRLVFKEFVRTIESTSNLGDRILETIEFLGDRINLQAPNFSDYPEYRALIDFLDCLPSSHIVQLAASLVGHASRITESLDHQSSDHYWYLIAFWLIEHLGRLDEASTDCGEKLKAAVLSRYEREFLDNFIGQRQTLKPTAFFSTLPWHKLLSIHDAARRLLSPSICYHSWHAKVGVDDRSSASKISAVRHYLQVLICVATQSRVEKGMDRISRRIAELVSTLGFDDKGEFVCLFDSGYYHNEYDLWAEFCSYANALSDDVYADFIDHCLTLIPLNQLFVLLESSTRGARSRALQDQIANRQAAMKDDMGLSGIEQAFISACESGYTVLSESLLTSAKDMLATRFISTSHPLIDEKRRTWLSYEYKWALIDKADSLAQAPDEFASFARELKIPFERGSRFSAPTEQRYWRECEHFRRYMIARAYLPRDPEKCVRIMEILCRESNDANHGFLLFKGHIALSRQNTDASSLRRALSLFLETVGETEPNQMPNSWAAAILDVHRELHDAQAVDSFWNRLNINQKNRVEILYPYVQSLIEHGDAQIGYEVLKRYKEYHGETYEDLGLTDLLDEIAKALPGEHSMVSLAKIFSEQSQRDKFQLAKHYSEILHKEFSEYVDIVAPGKSPDEFLKDIVLEIADELVMRKKNLQMHMTGAHGETSFRITQEDLINDWFTSLFDKRMAEAQIGFRDQKRAGQSGSGHSPGEVDGFITDAKNRRIALFEAFRLFSNDTTVIYDHLNKIANYDNESLSPVFIVAYCDVGDFGALVQRYGNHVVVQDYAGFTGSESTSKTMDMLKHTDHLWLGIEKRRRGPRDINIYHLLLNVGMRSSGVAH